MTGILDQIALSSSRAQGTQFRPTTADEFFALRLAQKLHEASTAQHYADLFERYSQAQLLIAFRRAQATGSHLDPARSFHVELGRLTGRNGNGACTRQLAAIRIERRAVNFHRTVTRPSAAPPLSSVAFWQSARLRQRPWKHYRRVPRSSDQRLCRPFTACYPSRQSASGRLPNRTF